MASPGNSASDGCTLWIDAWRGRDMRACCAAHDLAYSIGAPPKEFADLELAACVTRATGDPVMAAIMWLGVALCGGLWWRRCRRRDSRA